MAAVTPEGKLLELIKKSQGKLRLRKQLKIFTKINIILIGIIVVILALFLIDMFTFDYNVPELNVDLPDKRSDIVPIMDDFEEDVDMDIGKKKDVIVSEEELVKDLTLLGIITGDSNQAIIEDKETNKTIFLYKGDSFKEFTVYDIGESCIVLDYKGKKIELNL